MATSKKRRTSDDEEKREDQDQRVTAALAVTHIMFIRSLAKAEQQSSSPPESKPNVPVKKRKIVEKEESGETLDLLLRWSSNTPKIPPQKEIVNAVGECSRPIQKQLTGSDIKGDQNRLMLGKEQVEKKMISLLDESEIPKLKEGLEVTVYGPDGEESTMMFKLWNEVKTPVLTCGWKSFVTKYELEMNKDFLTIWMFRHRETRMICFAIDSERFDGIEKPLCRKISKAVFKVHDSD